MTGETLLGSGTASAVMSTLLSLSRCTVEWKPPDRAARERELDEVTELRRVNLSPENRFDASALRGNSPATGTFRRAPTTPGARLETTSAAPSPGVRLSNGRRYMSKNDLTVVHAPELNTSATAKKKKTSRTAKLKSSGWYEGASRSIGINRNRREKRKEPIDD